MANGPVGRGSHCQKCSGTTALMIKQHFKLCLDTQMEARGIVLTQQVMFLIPGLG